MQEMQRCGLGPDDGKRSPLSSSSLGVSRLFRASKISATLVTATTDSWLVTMMNVNLWSTREASPAPVITVIVGVLLRVRGSNSLSSSIVLLIAICGLFSGTTWACRWLDKKCTELFILVEIGTARLCNWWLFRVKFVLFFFRISENYEI